jgi:DNA-binding transcriptional LysR family regulator
VGQIHVDLQCRHERDKGPHRYHKREHNCIRFRLPCGNFYPWVRGKNVEVEVGGSLVVNDPQLTINLAVLMYSAEGFVAPMIADGRLITLLDDSCCSGSMDCTCPSRRQNTAALQALIDFFKSKHARSQ